jgi:hypothetical protein
MLLFFVSCQTVFWIIFECKRSKDVPFRIFLMGYYWHLMKANCGFGSFVSSDPSAHG